MSTNYILDINHFEKKTKIGEGAFAKAYIVEEVKTKELYVAKILYKNVDDIPRDEKISLSNEVNIMSKVNHPAIIKFIGFSSVDFKNHDKPIIFIEYALNGSLKEILNQERQFNAKPSWDDTKKLINIFGIASGMMYLHSHNIIHRDLKPDNILMDKGLNPKISDFGLSKINHSKSSTLQSVQGIKGTPVYIAPEIWETQQYEKSGDVYSFSLIVYEIVTSEIPYANIESISQIYTKIVVDGYRPEFTFPVPTSYRDLIEKCWSYDPNDRPTFEQIVEILKNDAGFITSSVDKDEFMEYVYFAEDYKSTFDEKIQVIKLQKDSKSDENDLQIVTVDNQKKIVEKEDEVKISDLIKIAENDVNKQFVVGKNYVEGINGFPCDTTLGIKYLKKSSKAGCIESTIYYCNLLIEGKFVPKNIKKAKKYLSRSLHLKDPIIYDLYTRIQNEEKDQINVNEHLKNEEENSNPESQFELGKYYFNKAVEYLLNSQKNGCTKSAEFLSESIKEINKKIHFDNEINLNLDKQKQIENFHPPYQDELHSLLSKIRPIEGRQRAVLVSTGSFCPIHKGHLKLFDTAAKFLSEKHNIDTILGIISPTSDIFVEPKFGSSAISFEHRYEMTKLACLEHNKELNCLKIIPDSWEGTRMNFIDFHHVYNHFKKEINSVFHDENLIVLYVCGGDLFIKRKCNKRKGIVGISRPGFQINATTDVENQIFVCNDKKYSGSYRDASFAINLAKDNGQSIEGLTYESVAKYLHDNLHWI